MAIFLRIIWLVVAFLTLAGCSKSEGADKTGAEQAEGSAMPVEVYRAERTHYDSAVEYSAIAKANRTVDIRTRVSGYIQSKHFIEGEFVNAGQLLFKIDDRYYLSKLKMARAEVRRGKALVEKIKIDLDRAERLRADSFVSDAEYESLRRSYKESVALLGIAEAELDTAQLDYEYTNIQAPFSGYIGITESNVGHFVNEGDDILAKITDINPIYVEYQVPEDKYIREEALEIYRNQERVKRMEIEAVFGENGHNSLLGKINYVGKNINGLTGTVTIRAEFDNQLLLLIPGARLKVVERIKNIGPAILVPDTSIYRERDGSFVWVVKKDKTVLKQLVETGDRVRTFRVVKNGLEEGELVVSHYPKGRFDGVNVQPVVVNQLQGPALSKTIDCYSDGEFDGLKDSAETKPADCSGTYISMAAERDK